MSEQKDRPIGAIGASMMTLMAPIRGELISLTQVPDQAFAQKMVGDGAAIDPVEGLLKAPCDGKVTMIHPSCHAVSIEASNGVEVLMHIGIDTVKLRGDGFSVKVSTGQQVKTGDILIQFDVDFVAQHATSLITPVLITNQEKIDTIILSSEPRTEFEQMFYQVKLKSEDSSVALLGEQQESSTVKVANHTGIHARPAAYIAKIANLYGGEIVLKSANRQANARSVTAIMGLNIGFGDDISFSTNGADAEEALAALTDAVLSGLGEEVQQQSEDKHALERVKEPSLLFPTSENTSELKGITASPGFALGPIFKFEKESFEYEAKAQNSEQEQQRLTTTILQAQASLQAAINEQQEAGNKDQFEILSAHLLLLTDPSLVESASAQIKQSVSAPAAWQHAIDEQVHVLEGLANPLMQQRAADLKDVGDRVLRVLLGKTEDPLANLPENCILVAEELTPSQIAGFEGKNIKAVLTTTGSASSHVAIIARSLSLAMLAAVDKSVLELANDTELLVDANKGVVLVSPTEDAMAQLKLDQDNDRKLKEQALAQALQPAITQDNVEVEVAANIGDVKDAKKAAEQGADGIGLLRSEFLFLDRLNAPSEQEQFEAYSEMLEGIGVDKPAIVRTLDVGGDKPLPYVPIEPEENPFLGERGIRICLDRPEILREQFRALLRASVGKKLRIMLPMISSLTELKLARKVLDQEAEKLSIKGVELGVMIEVPSAALMADVLAQEADFFSIGTNDLTQYTLAMDRGNARLAPLADNLDPAVLRMIDLTVKGARKHNRWVGVCGGMAAQPLAQPILLGLGVNELSVQISAVAETKYRVRALNMKECQDLAQQALACATTDDVKELVRAYQQ
ncbi:phosphoenolpyruvate--protein phosphotransferase [Thalassotalea aquiviva]|uniref:phosphoenolpyruvate--protein phosphotransferase n=1 Tax=Thalassotalea aquiviva TaxID=3242415 RepID=UPI00352A6609